MENVVIPNNVKEIGNGAFRYCYKLKDINLDENVVYIGGDVFLKTAFLENLDYDEFGCKYYKDILLGCNENSLKVVVKNGTRIIAGGAFKYLNNLENVELPETLISIGNNAFQDCSKIKEIKLPSGLDKIGEYVFRGCESLRKINIPPKIKEIKEYTFAYCSSLEEVDISNRDIVIDETAFKDSKFTYKGVVND